MIVDLHCHSRFSDGNQTVEALLEQALHQGVDLLALTDHDTVEGVALLKKCAKNKPIRIISGIEISTKWKKYDIHILGLNIDADAPVLRQLLAQQTERRLVRAREISHQLAASGLQDAYEKARELASHHCIARPHFAQVLVREGFAPDIKTAFKRFLKKGQVAYVTTQWPTLDHVVGIILEAGGDAVIAHPWKYGFTRTKLQELIMAFKSVGGLGLEVVSSQLDDAMVKTLATWCQRYDLWASTGSDYHGEGLSRVGLGQQRCLPAGCRPIWDRWEAAA